MKMLAFTIAALVVLPAVALAQAQKHTRLSPQQEKPASPASTPSGSATATRVAKTPLPDGVLATGPTPLTRAMVAEMAETLGRAIGSPLPATEIYRLEQRAVDFWKRSEGYQDSVRDAHAHLAREAERVDSFPAAARPNAWKQAEERLLAETKERPETFLADAVRRAEAVAHEQYVLGNPPLSKSAAQAYFEMRDFLGDLAQGRIRPPKVGEVLEGGLAIGRYFATAPEDERRFLHAADRTWALARAHVASMPPAELTTLKRLATETVAKAGAVDANGVPTVRVVEAFYVEAGLTKSRDDCYWTPPSR
jgi:hypothetical protein